MKINTYKNLIIMGGTQMFSKLGYTIHWAILPVLITRLYNEKISGIAIAIFTVLQVVLFDSLGGYIADTLGAKRSMFYSSLLQILSLVIWIIYPYSIINIILSSIVLFVSISLFTDDAYVLRTTDQDKGGRGFGLVGSIFSIAELISSVLFTFFIGFLDTHNKIIIIALIIIRFISLAGIFFIQNDKIDKNNKVNYVPILGLIDTIKKGIHFVKINKNYPLLVLGNGLFEGTFYGAIWFIFPIHLAIDNNGIIDSLQLGIYDLMSVLLYFYTGYLADKYNWKRLSYLGWLFILFGLFLMYFFNSTFGLIFLGILIGIGNNLSTSSIDHVLEKYDIDHEDDGSFIAFNKIIQNIGYTISPLIMGYIYYNFDFNTSLMTLFFLCFPIISWIIWQTYKRKF